MVEILDVCAMSLFFHPLLYACWVVPVESISQLRLLYNSYLSLVDLWERILLVDHSNNTSCEFFCICSMCMSYTLTVRVSCVGCRWRFLCLLPFLWIFHDGLQFFCGIDYVYMLFINFLSLFISATPLPTLNRPLTEFEKLWLHEHKPAHVLSIYYIKAWMHILRKNNWYT